MILTVLDEIFGEIGTLVNIPADQIRLVSCLLISYPIGFIFKLIKNTQVRHILSIALGLFFQFIIYRSEVIFPLLLALFGFFGVKVLGRNSAKIIFVISLVYLSLFHIWRMYIDWGGYSIEVTAVLMIFVCKCTSLAWCYKDGGADDSKLSEYQRKKKVIQFPSFLEYMSYMYFYGNALVGPACDYIDHIKFMKREGEYAHIPNTLLPSLGYLICGFLNMGIIVLFAKEYNAQGTLTEAYASMGFLGKFWYLTFAMQVQRCRYYTAWLIGTANVTSPGMNYNPNGKTWFERFGKVVGVRPIDMETNDNVKDKLEAWNTPSQIWLKYYVYFRICSEEEARKNPKKATNASNLTFMVSAFWHGFYPGYYLAFFWMFLAQQIAKSLYRIRQKLRVIPEPIGFVLRWLLSGFCINWMGSTFVLLELSHAITLYKAWLFIPNVLLIVLFLFFNYSGIGKAPRTSKPKGAESVKETPQTQETKKE